MVTRSALLRSCLLRASLAAGACLIALGLGARAARAETAAPDPAAAGQGAQAAPAGPQDPAVQAVVGKGAPDAAAPRYRSGFVIGGAAGLGLASVAGFPNDAKQIGRARYYTETGARFGGFGSVWLGGALADWFVFGVGVGGGRIYGADGNVVESGAVLFHLEAFPLFALGGGWRDVGVMVNAGTGLTSVTPDQEDARKLVDSGAASLIGGGLFWEPFKLWHLRGGPYLEGNYFWSASARRPGIFLGWRTSFYGG